MNKIFLYIFVMALVTYAVRMLPFVLFRRKIKSRYLKSLLHYIPYAVLSAMIIPDVFFSVGTVTTPLSVAPAVAGTLTAVILSYAERSLLTVAISACGVAYVSSLIILYM